jgi:hypothetical protein
MVIKGKTIVVGEFYCQAKKQDKNANMGAGE